ncbi:MAG TPA: hypothetical protein VGL91_00720 [Acidobacteriota bacterium]|jgi:hypothetical protein
MKPLLWIDAKILQLFALLTKKFNWLTGKDNFFLAKLCLVFYSICLSRSEPVGFTIWALSLALGLIVTVERGRSLETTTGAKNLDLWSALVILRIAGWADLVRRIDFHWIVTTVCLASILYFLSVDRPPFRRSQAREKLADWLSSAVGPLAHPAPVARR